MKVKSNLSESEILHKAAAYCSTAEHCTFEVKEKLLKWGASQEECNRILKRLSEERFVDDNRYAIAFCKDKFRFSKWGKTKIKFALQQKKIDKNLIEEAIANLDQDNYQDNLLEILVQKRKSIKDVDYQTTKAKLFRFAASRGYEPSLIFSSISKILNHASDDLD